MRSTHTRFISRIVLLTILSGAVAAPAFAAAVGPGPGGPGGGAPGGGAPGGGSSAAGAGGSGTHAYTSARAGGCTADSYGKAAPIWFAWQNSPNGQPCGDFRN